MLQGIILHRYLPNFCYFSNVTTLCQLLHNDTCTATPFTPSTLSQCKAEQAYITSGVSAIYPWPIVPAPGDYEDGEFGGINWQGKGKYSEKNCPGATLSTTNPT
jgi:hypothetical protein